MSAGWRHPSGSSCHRSAGVGSPTYHIHLYAALRPNRASMSSTPATQARPVAASRVPWMSLVLLACALLALAGGLLHHGYLSLASALLLLLAWLPAVWRRHSTAATLAWLGLAALLLLPALFGHAGLALMALP